MKYYSVQGSDPTSLVQALNELPEPHQCVGVVATGARVTAYIVAPDDAPIESQVVHKRSPFAIAHEKEQARLAALNGGKMPDNDDDEDDEDLDNVEQNSAKGPGPSVDEDGDDEDEGGEENSEEPIPQEAVGIPALTTSELEAQLEGDDEGDQDEG
jgi:hypothetical protein